MPDKSPRPDPQMARLPPPANQPWARQRPANPAAPFSKTEAQVQRVRALAAVGVPQDQIALVLRIDPKTLRKHFRDELATAAAEANAQVGGRLFKLAMEGNPIACIFWAKARMGWIDRHEVNHNVNIGGTMSHEDRLSMLERDPDEPPTIDGEATDTTEDDDQAPEPDGAA